MSASCRAQGRAAVRRPGVCGAVSRTPVRRANRAGSGPGRGCRSLPGSRRPGSRPAPRPGRRGPGAPSRARVGAARAVVAHLDERPPVLAHDRDVDPRCARVLGDVRERLGHDVVRGRLDLGRHALLRQRVDRDRYRRAAGDGLERRREPAVGEDGRVDAAGQLAQLLQRRRELLAGRLQKRVRRVGVGVEPRPSEAQRKRERDEPLLGAVVEVSLEPAPLGVARLDDARA